jgi:hypothetical protein
VSGQDLGWVFVGGGCMLGGLVILGFLWVYRSRWYL